MLKKELVKKICARTSLEEGDVSHILDVMLDEITESLKSGEEIKLFGFGKFTTRKYGERKCYNPVTGDIINLKSSVQPAFTAGPKLRSELNK